MPDSGSSAGIASVHTDIMCVMRRSVKDLEDRAAIILKMIRAEWEIFDRSLHSLAQIEPVFDNSVDILPTHLEHLGCLGACEGKHDRRGPLVPYTT
jgi:hypothetical protein